MHTWQNLHSHKVFSCVSSSFLSFYKPLEHKQNVLHCPNCHVTFVIDIYNRLHWTTSCTEIKCSAVLFETALCVLKAARYCFQGITHFSFLLAGGSVGGYAPLCFGRSLTSVSADESGYIVLFEYMAQVITKPFSPHHSFVHSDSSEGICVSMIQADLFCSHLSQELDELSVSRGEHVQVLERGEDGWWMVEKEGMTGLVPGNYLGKM